MDDFEIIFKGLADRTRLRILNLLLEGELCVCDIQYVLAAPQPNVSRHLAYLKHSGLVLDRRDGQRMFYRLPEPASTALRGLFSYLAGAFSGSEGFAADARKLSRAIARGACTISERREPAPVPGTVTAGRRRAPSRPGRARRSAR